MSESVAIRIWHGCKVVYVMKVDKDGNSTTVGNPGGAQNSMPIDIELDPWAGLVVDHRAERACPKRIAE